MDGLGAGLGSETDIPELSGDLISDHRGSVTRGEAKKPSTRAFSHLQVGEMVKNWQRGQKDSRRARSGVTGSPGEDNVSVTNCDRH